MMLRHIKAESILGFAYEVEARPCSCCNTDIPLAQGPPWDLEMGFVEWHKCPTEGAVLLADVDSSLRWFQDFSFSSLWLENMGER